MTKRERLEAAHILEPGLQLTPQQEQAIESLTNSEVDALIAVKNKIRHEFPAEGLVAPPIQHHH